MITYQTEELSNIKEELKPILEEHYDEVAMYKDQIALDPDWDVYHTMEEMGRFKIFTVRDSGTLVGYYMLFLHQSPHYKQDVFAVNDIVLIKKKYRNAKVGVGLFKFVEDECRALGASVMTVHMKTFLPFDRLCEGLGWDYAERLYTKCIKGDS